MDDKYIRLEDAINKAYELYEETDFSKAEELSAVVKSIPAADVRPVVRGRWVHPVPGDGEPYCSACHAEAEYFYGYGTFEPDFCPNCGADMREADDGD